MRFPHDLQGIKFGRLSPLRKVGTDNGGRAIWLCRCDCGLEVERSRSAMVSGYTKSCGCLRSEMVVSKNTSHGKSKTKTYRIWKSMRQRCENTNDADYYNYGGRGIKVCDEWQSYETFLSDMGEQPKGLSIDRINGNLGYNKDNCRWATDEQQANNTRRNIYIEHNGRKQSIAQWSRELRVPNHKVRKTIQEATA